MTQLDPRRWQRTQALFASALELDTSERDAMLAEACADDPALADEVRAMLRADSALGDAAPPSVVSSMDQWFDATLPPGTRLGAYVIGGTLGSGGMGHVYRAERDDGEVRQTVAIKCLRGGFATASARRRFLRERRILAKLAHPHIARFLDAGSDAFGRPYVVMEHVDGMPITHWCEQQRLGLRERVTLLLEVMDAVGYAHAQPLVHRDLKPGNVLVDRGGATRLLDFGIAKPLAALDAELVEASRTAPEQRVFSLAHAAPEQLRGDDTGTACDIYALGILLYQLLTDTPPFALEGLAYAEAERRILETMPPDPSVRMRAAANAPDAGDAQHWSRALTGDLDRITQHALRKQPHERYATVEAFAADLRRWLAHEPISLRGGQGSYRLRLFVARHRAASLLALAFVLSLIAGSVVLALQARDLARQRDVARQQQQKAEATTGILLDAIRSSDPAKTKGEELTARDVADNASRQIRNAGKLDPATRAQLLTSLSDVQRSLGATGEAQALAQEAFKLAEAQRDTRVAANAAVALAQAELQAGRVEPATLLYERATLLLDDAGDAVDENDARVRTMMLGASLAVAQNEHALALSRAEAGYAHAIATLGESNPTTLDAGATLVAQRELREQSKEAAALSQDLLRRLGDADLDPTGLRLLRTLTRTERQAGRIEEAARAVERLVAGVKKLYGTQHGAYASALDLQARVEGDAGRVERARALYVESLAITDQLSGGKPVRNYALALSNYAEFELAHEGDPKAALDAARRALRIAEATYAAEDFPLAFVRINLGESLLENALPAESEAQLRIADALWERNAAKMTTGAVPALTRILLADALHAQGQDDEARAQLGKALPRLAVVPGERHKRRAQRLARELGIEVDRVSE